MSRCDLFCTKFDHLNARRCTVWAIAALWGLESTVGAGILAGLLLTMNGKVCKCISKHLIGAYLCNLCTQEGPIQDPTFLSRTLSQWC